MNKVALFAIIGTAMFLLSAGASFAQAPASVTPSIQPNPYLQTNVTWSTFYNGWNPLEYSNGTGNATLNAQAMSVQINPVDIESSYLTNSNTTGIPYNSSKLVTNAGATGGSVQSVSYANGIYTLTQNTSASSTEFAGWNIPAKVPDTALPSNNMAYNFITIAYKLTGPDLTGVSATLKIWNSSGIVGTDANTIIYPGESIWESVPVSDFSGADFNTSVSSFINPELELYLPETASTTYTIQVSAFMITEMPLTLGTTNGTSASLEINPHLTTYKPNFPWTRITNSGYSESLIQPFSLLTNTTVTNTPISSGNYIEQVTYQGNFQLPSAPDLSYSDTSFLENLTVPASQTQVLDVNGVSYLNDISGKNGTVTLLTAVNPNTNTSFLQVIDFTQSQWNSISSPPGIFTIAGIEYYWWIAVGGLATLIGLAGAAKHAGTKADQEKTRRGR